MAQVETTQTDACHGCSAQTACRAMGGVKKRLVEASNDAGAKEGDRVLMALPRKGALAAGFLVYLGPVIALIAGAAIGQKLGPGWGYEAQNAAVVLGLCALGVSWFGLRWLSKRVADRQELKVRVVRVLPPKEGAPAECET